MNNLIPFYQQYFNLQDATFSRIEHEDAIVAIVYKVTQPNGKQFILKICTRAKDYFCEIYFLRKLAGIVPIPHVLQIAPPQKDIYGAIFMECLPGTVLKITKFTDALAYQGGSLLARLHLNREASYGSVIEPKELILDPWIYFAQKFEEVFLECSNHLPKALMDQCRNYYDMHSNLLITVDGPCIIHGDFRPGNIIAYNNEVQGIIDWSAGRAGFAEEDFCSIEHAEWQEHLLPDSKKSFLAGYASIRPVPDCDTIMPLLRLRRALDIIGFTVKHGTWDTSNAQLYQDNLRFLENFFRNLQYFRKVEKDL
jgi:Ser/Thr protein kinase RdoA (MazF antagonist)